VYSINTAWLIVGQSKTPLTLPGKTERVSLGSIAPGIDACKRFGRLSVVFGSIGAGLFIRLLSLAGAGLAIIYNVVKGL
jgi:hypothetical protein